MTEPVATLDEVEGVVVDAAEKQSMVQVLLPDGRVVAAKTYAVDPADGHECPVEWCHRRFETELSVNRHIGLYHKEGHESDCAECGQTFKNAPSQDMDHCSWECKRAANTKTKSCAACGDTIRTYNSDDYEYCSRQCFYESGKLRQRPDSLAGVLHDIKSDGFEDEKLEGRAYAHLSPELDRLDIAIAVLLDRDDPPHGYEGVIETVRQRDDLEITENQRALLDRVVRVACLLINDSIDHVGAAEFLAALEDASTMLEVQQIWRVAREDARRVVRLLGVEADVTTGEQEAYRRAKEVLEKDDVEFGAGGAWDDQRVAGGQSDD